MGVDFTLIVLVLVGLLLLGGLAAIIALLINPNTRVVGIVLLAIVLVVLTVALVGSATLWFVLDESEPLVMAVEQVGQLSFHTG